MKTILTTERLRLRTWSPADWRIYAAACNTPATTRWLGGPRDMETIATSAGWVAASEAEDGFSFWVVERRADRAMLGYCGLKIANDPGAPVDGEVEIGWGLRETAWGRGYAREAATACLAWAWARLDVARVVSITVPGNHASWGLMHRLGMTRRPDLDFTPPAFANDAELRHHITYVAERP